MIDRRDLDRLAAAASRRDTGHKGLTESTIARDCPCVSCGYNLKGSRFNGRCPECGNPTSRSIDPESPDTSPFQSFDGWRPRWWTSLFGPPVRVMGGQKTAPPATAGPSKPTTLLCPCCSYDCYGLPPGRPCPECGIERLNSVRVSSVDAHEAVSTLAPHSLSGFLLAFGWGATGAAMLLQWLVFGAEVCFADTPWALSGVFLYAVAAAGSATAAVAALRIYIINPIPQVERETALPTRLAGVAGAMLWSIVSLVISIGCWRAWSYDVIHAVHVGLLPAAVLLSFHCRVLYIVARIAGRAEQSIQSSTIGFPLSVGFLLGAAAWFVYVGRIPLISFITFAFVTLLGGIFTWLFFKSNVDIGVGICWARKSHRTTIDRRNRKIEKWQARAKADLEHERKHGNSAGL